MLAIAILNKQKPVATTGLMRLALASSLIVALSACAPSYQGPSAPVILMPPPASEPQIYPVPPAEPTPYPESKIEKQTTVIAPLASRPQVAPSAVDSLLNSAGEAYRDTRYDTAIAFAERALRIDSRRAEIYLVLGNCYLAKEQASQARQMALKGIAYSPAGSDIRRKLETLLTKTGNS